MVCAVLEPPAGFKHGLPATNASEPELILAFAPDRAALARVAAKALDLYGVGGRLWFAYPKKTANIRTDLDRIRRPLWNAFTRAVSTASATPFPKTTSHNAPRMLPRGTASPVAPFSQALVH